MDGPTALGEFVIREAAPSQGFKAGLFEVVEMDRVIDVSEGVQLVGTSLDYRFGNGQFAWPFSWRETRAWVSLVSPTR